MQWVGRSFFVNVIKIKEYFSDGHTEVWVEVCDIFGACARTEEKKVPVSKGAGRTVSTLIHDVAAHARRCELLMLRAVAVSAIATYSVKILRFILL